MPLVSVADGELRRPGASDRANVNSPAPRLARAMAPPINFPDLLLRGLAMVIFNLNLNKGRTGNIG